MNRVITDHADFCVGQRVQLTHCEQDEDDLWEYDVGGIYDVVEAYGGTAVGPADLAGDVPSENYHNWKWEVLQEAPALQASVVMSGSGSTVIHIQDEPQEIPATPHLKLITDHSKMRKGQRVRLIKKNGRHDHWGFKLGETYKVVENEGNSKTGPCHGRGNCTKNWDDWVWELIG